ncbi:response regulator [Coralloluteibacterium thermophilus]|uniref:histidine kinase n=1 Tax=Coralloluteibacterium thermophilum TaxID=2707049 RepID=A0ABV9NKY9_9GAMM
MNGGRDTARILIVDDNAASRYATRRILSARGHATVEAATGGEALTLADADIDLVILDVNLPDLSGFEVCRRLRASATTAATPIVHLSAAAVTTPDVVTGLEGGADAYLVHPVDPSILLATVGSLLRARRAELGMRRSEARFRAVFEMAGAGIVLLSAGFELGEVNPTFAQMLGMPPEALRGTPVSALVADAAGSRLEAARGALAREGTWLGTLPLRAADGRVVETEWRLGHHTDPATLLATVTDVTERQAMERLRELVLERERQARSAAERHSEGLEHDIWARTAELIEANARLEAEVRERERAEEQLRQSQKMDAVGRLTGGIAHDFNNLLTGITGNMELLKRRLQQGRFEGAERYADAALAASERAAALTHRLLAFSRQQMLAPTSVDAHALALSMQDMLQRTLGESIRLDIVAHGAPWCVLCDANQLENALLNLVINARDALPAGGTIAVTVRNLEPGAARSPRLPDELVAVEVADTGTGMSRDVVDKVFEPFFTTKPPGQGTGLGLSMVYGFVKQSGGDIEIASTPGEGTLVRLLLPRAHDAPGEARREARPPAPVAARGESLLVVEDNPQVRAVTVEALRELGYAVIEAADADEALQLLASAREVDLVISDIGLPGGDGRQMLARARMLRPELRALLVTGYAQQREPDVESDPRLTRTLTKPLSLQALADAVRSMLDAP